MVSVQLELPLRGAGGEPVDLRRTINSHGLVDLPPMRLVEDSRSLEVTLPLRRGRPRTVRIAEAEASTRQMMDVLGHNDIDHAELYPGKRRRCAWLCRAWTEAYAW